MQFTIEKGKIIEGKKVEVDTIETDDLGAKAKGWNEYRAPLHDDLKQSFENLGIHLALLTGYVKPSQVKNIEAPKPELSDSFHVTSFSLGGGEDSPGFVISGHKILEDGKAVILNTPFRRFEENPETGYQFMDDLQTKLKRVDAELRAYIDGSKRGADAQGKFDFDAGQQAQDNQQGPAPRQLGNSVEDAEFEEVKGDGEQFDQGPLYPTGAADPAQDIRGIQDKAGKGDEGGIDVEVHGGGTKRISTKARGKQQTPDNPGGSVN